ncbi:uncharacterized protein EV422DRAFT_570246 [Fimicolochytrium jonesii]|uniref:uncharacterized protein n=1 Tax=Fimicolochytrium jonesii TaxID=1396493 RepID=UPI0022FEBEB6|nr:uncharacterized protein EV422DRAFT_570246 [Fimicolochytrium jonesii]KAI8817781.1 hypothetical protein EV422DRAFT_570246 [Fimicolochytrium jonesii]
MDENGGEVEEVEEEEEMVVSTTEPKQLPKRKRKPATSAATTTPSDTLNQTDVTEEEVKPKRRRRANGDAALGAPPARKRATKRTADVKTEGAADTPAVQQDVQDGPVTEAKKRVREPRKKAGVVEKEVKAEDGDEGRGGGVDEGGANGADRMTGGAGSSEGNSVKNEADGSHFDHNMAARGKSNNGDGNENEMDGNDQDPDNAVRGEGSNGNNGNGTEKKQTNDKKAAAEKPKKPAAARKPRSTVPINTSTSDGADTSLLTPVALSPLESHVLCTAWPECGGDWNKLAAVFFEKVHGMSMAQVKKHIANKKMQAANKKMRAKE